MCSQGRRSTDSTSKFMVPTYFASSKIRIPTKITFASLSVTLSVFTYTPYAPSEAANFTLGKSSTCPGAAREWLGTQHAYLGPPQLSIEPIAGHRPGAV